MVRTPSEDELDSTLFISQPLDTSLKTLVVSMAELNLQGPTSNQTVGLTIWKAENWIIIKQVWQQAHL